MPQLKPVYLVHGDDHGAVAQRRAGLRALAEGLGDILRFIGRAVINYNDFNGF